MMPKKDGFHARLGNPQRELRDTHCDSLTAKSLKDDIFEGFKIGADDYITKPFSMEELVFRIEAILRRVKEKTRQGDNDVTKNRQIHLRHPEAGAF